MALQFGTTVRNAMVDAIETAAGSSVHVCLFSGAAPANCGTANSGTLIATFSLDADWANTAASGVKSFMKGAANLSSGNPQTTTAAAAGTPAHFRLFINNAGSPGTTCHMQGTVATSGADLNIDNTTITLGQTIQITGWTLTAPGA